MRHSSLIGVGAGRKINADEAGKDKERAKPITGLKVLNSSNTPI
jgi:hypothetical protein